MERCCNPTKFGADGTQMPCMSIWEFCFFCCKGGGSPGEHNKKVAQPRACVHSELKFIEVR